MSESETIVEGPAGGTTLEELLTPKSGDEELTKETRGTMATACMKA